jgi:hypothetical protein
VKNKQINIDKPSTIGIQPMNSRKLERPPGIWVAWSVAFYGI